MHIILKSASLSISSTPDLTSLASPVSLQNIYLFYFLSKEDTGKLNRLSSALEHNIANPHITKIFVFTDDEKRQQVVPSVEYISTSKFYFSQIQDFIEEHGLQGYMIIGTPYTTFGENLRQLKGTSLHAEAAVLNVNAAIANTGAPQKYNMCANIFVFHSNMNVSKERRKIFNINMMRIASCSKILYLFYILNYRLYNESATFQCYTAQPNPFMDFSQYFQAILTSRAQHKQDTQSPFILMEPADITIIPPPLLTTIQFGNRYDIRKDTNTLFHYVRERLENGKKPFVIPRIAGIENQLAVNLSVLSNGTYRTIANPQLHRWFQPYVAIMKKNAGIKITTVESALLYAKLYARVCGQCDMYTDWPSWGAVGQVLGRSQQYWRDHYRKPTLWAFVYDLYHTIYARPWTHALKGKRVLIISSFVESYKKKVDAGVLDKIYGIDLFPECELLFLKPPQTQGSNPSEEFHVELERFGKQIEKIKDQFDVALCSCGGYGNLVSGKIFEMGKSAIYVGGVLQMYFGVLGQRWLRERPDVVRLFMNEHWSRPQDSEKPKDYKQVEGSCYW